MKILTKTASVLALVVICVTLGCAQTKASNKVQQRSIVASKNVELVIEGNVINVHDGDTITVQDKHNKRTHIRLPGKRAGNCPAEVQPVVVKFSSSSVTVKPIPIPTNPSPERPVVTAVPLASKVLAPNQGQIIGNKNSKIYHVPGCSTYNSVSEKNRVLFNTTDDAEKAGYRRAKTCH